MTRLDRKFLDIPLAHRALHDVSDGRPENSRAAIKAAIEHGYGIEIDVQLSLDGAAMVFHDYDMTRLTGQSGPVQRRDASDLSKVVLLGSDEGIPELSEVLRLVDGQVPLLIELKDQYGQMGQTDGRLENATSQALEAYTGAVGVMSFNPEMMMLFAKLSPNIPRGLVTCGYTKQEWPLLRDDVRSWLRDIPDYERIGASFISHDATDLDRARVSELKSDGADVLCWTVRSHEDEAKAREIAVNVTFERYLAALPA